MTTMMIFFTRDVFFFLLLKLNTYIERASVINMLEDIDSACLGFLDADLYYRKDAIVEFIEEHR